MGVSPAVTKQSFSLLLSDNRHFRKGITMDIYCPKCGEPWDPDEAHEQAADTGSTYTKVMRDFAVRGCRAFGGRCSAPDGTPDATFGMTRAEASGALFELLGDDVDGVASMLDDMTW